jgi:hypothetical protein
MMGNRKAANVPCECSQLSTSFPNGPGFRFDS